MMDVQVYVKFKKLNLFVEMDSFMLESNSVMIRTIFLKTGVALARLIKDMTVMDNPQFVRNLQ